LQRRTTRHLNFGVRSARTISAFLATFIQLLLLKQYRPEGTTYFLINPAFLGALKNFLEIF